MPICLSLDVIQLSLNLKKEKEKKNISPHNVIAVLRTFFIEYSFGLYQVKI